MGKPHIIATFYDLHSAEEAFHALLHIVPRDDISFIHRPDPTRAEGDDMSSDHPLNGILYGSAIGGVGGALTGLSLLAFPGLGALLALGPIYAALAGATTGGIIGGLMDIGINKYEAEEIEKHVKGGAVVLTIEAATPKVYDLVSSTLKHYGANYITNEPIVDDTLE
ncbi:hypothetical protein BKP35_13030 [Anaerobacillus arseniciselenatis]|uniref:DUF1269 domain-containing protein n=1 Tax=Anaerobacillus arseniciselenatis TaxID=85682 RepID=A0A1S2LEQ3_9BACI|nr:DUF1269 domain-containing protein [Anaerobacillus arseniciselenatis]OIJ10999.1 hypothetical protein BKP35_13030 [Anaerobacillus arseniciselenatis]